MVLNKPLTERNNLLFLFCLVLYIEGPVHWNEFFPIADGDQQSPIEIKTKEVRYDSSLRPLGIKYDASSAKIISNSGHSFNVDFDDTDDKSGWLYLFLVFFLVGGEEQSPWVIAWRILLLFKKMYLFLIEG